MEPQSSFKVRITKNYTPDDGEKYWDWIRSVHATLGLLRSRPRDASTYRVPTKLRAIKHEAYTPHMVSIGPFHRHKPELRSMDELKWRYMLDFVDRVVESDMGNIQSHESDCEYIENSPEILALDKCSKVISEVEEEARAWYGEDINLNKHQLVEMLLVDGCFLIELFCRCNNMISARNFNDTFAAPEDQIPFESLAGNTTIVHTLTHDLILLENQVPYVILQQLFDIIPSSKRTSVGFSLSLQEYVFRFFNSVPMLQNKMINLNVQNKNTCIHLLDMLYPVCNLTFNKVPSNYSQNSWGFKRCATELFKYGVQIRCDHSRTIVDIKFIKGELSIPQVSIDKLSDTFFRNLIALEQTSIGRQALTSYVKLMTTLIRSWEDAYLLERLGIIKKSDDIEDVSSFFRSLCREVVFVDFCFTDMCEEVENYHIPLWRWSRAKGFFSIKYVQWKESVKDLRRDYFRNRWSFIAFLAACFVIILALVQTFYTVRSYYSPYH